MSLGAQTLINQERAFYLSSIPNDVIHRNVLCDTIIANTGYISTLYSDNAEFSTLNASTLAVKSLDVSGMFVSSITGNFGKFSTLQLASDLSGGVGFVNFTTDASGIIVTGDPIKFNNLVYLTSTINIVQVSTIVDTDIFASNGYFSTISTNNLFNNQGIFSSIICYDLSGQNGSFDRLFVSSLEALDISGVAASNWSQFPTQNSSIIFQAPYVLSNVSNKLYFAGQELTDASGGGIDWSYFAAQTDVSMNNFSLRGLSTLQYQDGATLVSQTGNNLFYNGQPVQYGAVSNVSQWANYPAVNTLQTGGFPISSLGNLNLVANSNVRILADSFSTVADQGLLAPAAYADINLTAQNGLKGRINLTANPGAAGLFGEINMTANGGTVAGVGTGGLVAITANTPLGTLCNATSAIKLSASGINSYAGAIPSVGSLAGYNFIYGTGGVNIVAGVIPSVIPNTPFTTYLYGAAGVVSGNDFYTPNIYPYWNGLTTPPDMNITGRYILPNLAQVYVNLSNVNHIYMDATADIQNARYVSTVSTVGQNANFNTGTYGTLAAGAVGASAGLFTTLDAGSISSGTVTSVSTNTSTLRANFTQISTLFYNFALGVSTTVGALQVNNIQIADNITGVTNAPNPLQSRLLNFSTVNSFNVSTTDFWCSSINGQAIDISGNPFVNTNTFSTLFTSSFQVSSMRAVGGLPIKVESLLQFASPDSIDNVVNINLGNTIPITSINASTIILSANNTTTTSFSTIRVSASNARITDLSATNFQFTAASGSNVQVSSLSGFGGFGIKVDAPILFSTRNAIDNVDVINLNPPQIPLLAIGASTINLDTNNVLTTSISTINLSADYIITSTITANPPYTGEIFFDGQLRPLNNIIVLYNNNILFQDSTGTAPQLINMKPLASIEMPVVTNSYGTFSNNLGSLGANSFYVGGGYGAFGGAKFYSAFPGTAWAIDIMDADGTTLFESINSYDVGGFNFQTNIYGVSTINGYTPISPGLSSSVTFDTDFVVAPCVSTNALIVSTINGAPVDGSAFDNQFSTLYVSSLNFSTSFSYGSNTGTTYPIFIEKDHAGGATSGDAVAIAVQGHNLGTGAVRNQIEMGARGSGENYIMSVWPGQNLEELFIDATDLTVRDGIFSTIINLDPWGLQTTGGIKGPFISTLDINVSTINGSIYPWTSTLGGVVSTFTVDGTTATTPQLIGQISFPYAGDYFLTQKVAFTKLTGGAAQDCHGMILLNGGGIPTFPGGDYGLGALPYINENNASTFDTVVTNIQLLSSGTKQIYYYDPTGNNYTASLITDLPVVHFNPGAPA